MARTPTKIIPDQIKVDTDDFDDDTSGSLNLNSVLDEEGNLIAEADLELPNSEAPPSAGEEITIDFVEGGPSEPIEIG